MPRSMSPPRAPHPPSVPPDHAGLSLGLDLLRSMRLSKNLSMLMLVASGAALVGGPVDGPNLLASLFGLLVAASLTTQVNTLTDVEIDRARKPELIAALTRHRAATRGLMLFEALLLAGCVAALLRAGAAWSGASLGLATAVGLLYSYNFFAPSDPVRWRWKAHWVGHAASFLLGYQLLWLVGYGCARAAARWPSPDVLLIMAGASASDYALYLAESAGDASEERSGGLRTLPATLGPRATTALAAAAGVATTLWLAAVCASSRRWWAFVPSASLRAALVVTLASPWMARRPLLESAFRGVGCDALFHATRLATLVTLARS